MKKATVLLVLLITLLLVLPSVADDSWVCSGCGKRIRSSMGDYCPYCMTHNHKFEPATCTVPEKCACGVVRGEPLGHKWHEATCTEPRTITNGIRVPFWFKPRAVRRAKSSSLANCAVLHAPKRSPLPRINMTAAQSAKDQKTPPAPRSARPAISTARAAASCLRQALPSWPRAMFGVPRHALNPKNAKYVEPQKAQHWVISGIRVRFFSMRHAIVRAVLSTFAGAAVFPQLRQFL